MDGSQCLWLEQPTQSRLEDRLKSWKAPRLGLDPQAILRSGGQEDAIHTESWLKHAEHLKSSLPTSNPPRTIRRPLNRPPPGSGNSGKASILVVSFPDCQRSWSVLSPRESLDHPNDEDYEPNYPSAKGKSQVCLYVLKVPVMY